jgi:hypothetical protein
VRHQAAAVTAALALSSPPLLAVLFGECLEGVETFCQQLMLLAAPYTKRGGGSAVHMSASGGGGGVPGGNHAAPGSDCAAALCIMMLTRTVWSHPRRLLVH